jgi:putative ABC transport system permease protein
VLKTLGFTSWHLVGLITGESLFIASVGGAIGLAVTFPIADGFKNAFPTIFPVFSVSPQTIFLSATAAIFVGIVASVIPTLRAVNMSIVNGLRQIG